MSAEVKGGQIAEQLQQREGELDSLKAEMQSRQAELKDKEAELTSLREVSPCVPASIDASQGKLLRLAPKWIVVLAEDTALPLFLLHCARWCCVLALKNPLHAGGR